MFYKTSPSFLVHKKYGVGGLTTLICTLCNFNKISKPAWRFYTLCRTYREENLFRNYKVNCLRIKKLE